MHDASTGVGSFDLQTRQVLWKYAVMAWADGWPIARGSAGRDESEDEAAVDIKALPREAVEDTSDGRFKFRSHSVHTASLDEAWQALDAVWQE